jgi:hypothetical protein
MAKKSSVEKFDPVVKHQPIWLGCEEYDDEEAEDEEED